MIINNKIYKYIKNIIKKNEPKYLKKIKNYKNYKKLKNIKKKIKNMMSDNLQGRFLSLISKIKNPKNILEIGTFLGYSTLCLSEGLKKNGLLITIEKNKKFIYYAKKNFKKTKYNKNIKILYGNALKIIPNLKKKFDIVFIDADKKNNLKYFELIFNNNKLNKKGLIIIDNVLWKGKIINKKLDFLTKKINLLNKKIKKYKNINNIIIPIRDGLNLILKN
ncbi:MAG: class I SAM-dependent methyltransferase [Candidatus Shikimatogenerans bostrichidophilus]|nr:MAG: class I SAM-dependent methyltransferase [Candidatus Shikimatogenerans bostrichidophilus]